MPAVTGNGTASFFVGINWVKIAGRAGKCTFTLSDVTAGTTIATGDQVLTNTDGADSLTRNAYAIGTFNAVTGHTLRLALNFKDTGASNQGAGFAGVDMYTNGSGNTPKSSLAASAWFLYQNAKWRQQAVASAGNQYDVSDWASGVHVNLAGAMMEWTEDNAGNWTSELFSITALSATLCTVDPAGKTSLIFNASVAEKDAIACLHSEILPPADPVIPDPGTIPAPPSDPCSTTADLCALLQDLLSDVQHLFAALSSATDQRTAMLAELMAALTSANNGISALAGNVNTAQGKLDELLADIAELLPLVEATLSADMGDPSSAVTGHLLAFLPAAMHELSLEVLSRAPATAKPLTLLSSGALATGDNVITVAAGARLLLVNVTTVPIGWGYRGLSPKEYEPLGYVSLTASTGHLPPVLLHYQASALDLPVNVPIAAAQVYLYVPMTGTYSIYGG